MKSMGKKEKPVEAVEAVDSKGKIVYPSFSLSSKVVPEIEDYSIKDIVDMNIVCKIKSIRQGWDDKKEIVAELEITKAEITNLKEERKDAKEKNLDMKDYKEIFGKKKKNA